MIRVDRKFSGAWGANDGKVFALILSMNKWRFVLKSIVFLSVFGAQISHCDQTLDEASCSSKDMSAPLGELRNQGNIGWCFANVAADLLTFRYKDDLKGQQASAGYVAIVVNSYVKPRPNDEAGLISAGIFFSQFHDICPQAFQDQALGKSPYKTIREQIDALVELKISYNTYKKERRDMSFLKELDVYRKSGSYINKLKEAELLKVLDESTVRNFPRKLTDLLCKDRKIPIKMDLNIRFQFGFSEGIKNYLPELFAGLPDFFKGQALQSSRVIGQRDLIEEIHEIISNNNIAAIGYYTRIFYDPASEKYEKSHGFHASSIVGRRWNPDQRRCELKLRNSWGKRCDLYTNHELKGMCDEKTGYLWIPDTLLRKGMNDLVYYPSYKFRK